MRVHAEKTTIYEDDFLAYMFLYVIGRLRKASIKKNGKYFVVSITEWDWVPLTKL